MMNRRLGTLVRTSAKLKDNQAPVSTGAQLTAPTGQLGSKLSIIFDEILVTPSEVKPEYAMLRAAIFAGGPEAIFGIVDTPEALRAAIEADTEGCEEESAMGAKREQSITPIIKDGARIAHRSNNIDQ